MNILDAIADPHLFGGLPVFGDLATWRSWLAFLRAFYGLPMDADDLALFQRHTGRSSPRPGGYPEAVCVVGCQSGKSQVASVVGVFEAIQAVGRGSRGVWVPLIAQDMRNAQRTLFGYVRECFDLPMLQPEVVRDTTEALEMRGGVTVAVYPCRPAAIRGIRAAAVIIDELAFFTATDGRATDTEMLRAARSRVATTGGRILILSSPYAQRGALWDLHRRHYGQDTAVLVWQASAPEMNPCLPGDYLERMREDDPEAYRSEVLGEFRAGLASLFDPEALDAVVATDRREVEPVPGSGYQAFVDPSGGRGDAFTVAIGHRASDRAVVDVARAWRPPFNPSGVTEEAAALLKSYGCHTVTGDRYGGEWPREAFRAHGIAYELAAADKSDLYLAMLPVVNAGGVELLDLPELLRELRGLERRRGTSGRDRVDHARGAHDDQANAVAGLLSLLRTPAAPVGVVAEGPPTVMQADYRTRPEAASDRLFGGRRNGLRLAR